MSVAVFASTFSICFFRIDNGCNVGRNALRQV